MSVRTNHRSRHGTPIYSQGFSSKSTTLSEGAPVMAVTTDQSLLASLNLEIDPKVKSACTQEKEQIKTLNNDFISYINKVRTLQQQNKMLQTKWKLLNKQTDSHSNVESILKSCVTHLERQLDDLKRSNEWCEKQNEALHHKVDEYKEKYEQEYNARTDAENQFVLMKKEVDIGCMSKANLFHKLSSLRNEYEFLKTLYEEERQELQQRVANTYVVVEMDNSRNLNMEDIMSQVKAQYENAAARGREKEENWYKTKLNHMAAEASRNDAELHDNKKKVAELKQNISRIKLEIQAVSSEISSCEKRLAEAEKNGDSAVKEAKTHIMDLEQALNGAKLSMAKQTRDYQNLMNAKMGLDIEISTYMKLLEEEEKKIQNPSFLNVKAGVPKAVTTIQSPKSGPILIKIVETQEIIYS